MPALMPPKKVLDEYALEVRCKLIEIAAILDRYDRACAADPAGAPKDDDRLRRFRESLEILNKPHEAPNRAEQVALVFSDPA